MNQAEPQIENTINRVISYAPVTGICSSLQPIFLYSYLVCWFVCIPAVVDGVGPVCHEAVASAADAVVAAVAAAHGCEAVAAGSWLDRMSCSDLVTDRFGNHSD